MPESSLAEHFRMLGRYNTVANERVYAACATVPDEAYRQEQMASFGSIHRTLNHLLLADRIWMGRFTTDGVSTTPPLTAILFEDFGELREARQADDARIEAFLADLTDADLTRDVRYINSAGIDFADPLPLVLQHMFNHATHHRGQVHVLLSAVGTKGIPLDMHRALKPA